MRRELLLTSDGIGELQSLKEYATLLHSSDVRNDGKGESVRAHIHISIRSLGRTEKRDSKGISVE